MKLISIVLALILVATQVQGRRLLDDALKGGPEGAEGGRDFGQETASTARAASCKSVRETLEDSGEYSLYLRAAEVGAWAASWPLLQPPQEIKLPIKVFRGDHEGHHPSPYLSPAFCHLPAGSRHGG
jgi:hypothetical protein